LPGGPGEPPGMRSTRAQLVMVTLGLIAFLYFAQPVVLPIFLACMATMALKPLMRWLSLLRIPTVVSATIVICLLAAAIGVGSVQLGRPAVRWMDEAPQHMIEVRQRIQKLFPKAVHLTHAVTAVIDLGSTENEKKEEEIRTPVVEVKDRHVTTSILSWTGNLLGGLGEVIVLVYLLLASGDLFLQKLVRMMPTLSEKKRAVEISHEIQQNISKYLFSVSLINTCLGTVVGAGLHFMGVPNAAMWGMFIALLNFVPYFGPVLGVVLLASVGLLSFDSLWQIVLPPLWYLALHLLESNVVTPVVLGRSFTLSPVAIFISLMVWLWLWGVPGALLAVPILVSAKVVCDRIPAAAFFGELIGS
jgi:predicted PurR-regulated permease PerM